MSHGRNHLARIGQEEIWRGASALVQTAIVIILVLPFSALAATLQVGPGIIGVRNWIFESGARFDEAVGPQPGQYRMGSETEFVRRLSKLGHRGWHCDASRVTHIIRPEHMDADWIIDRAYRFGLYHEEREETMAGVAMLMGVPRWRVRRYLEAVARISVAKVLRDFDREFLARWEISCLRGYFAEAKASSAYS